MCMEITAATFWKKNWISLLVSRPDELLETDFFLILKLLARDRFITTWQQSSQYLSCMSVCHDPPLHGIKVDLSASLHRQGFSVLDCWTNPRRESESKDGSTPILRSDSGRRSFLWSSGSGALCLAAAHPVVAIYLSRNYCATFQVRSVMLVSRLSAESRLETRKARKTETARVEDVRWSRDLHLACISTWSKKLGLVARDPGN